MAEELISIAGFVLATVFFSLLPGDLLVGRILPGETGYRRAWLSLCTGIVLQITAGLAAAYLHARSGVGLVMLGMAAAALYTGRGRLAAWKTGWDAPHLTLIILTVLFSLSVTTSWWRIPGGMVLRSANGQDGIWNVALARELMHEFPPQHAGMSGMPLRGYHVLYNFWIAETGRMTGIPLTFLHYHGAAMLMSLLLVYGIYITAAGLAGSRGAGLWGVTVALFGGSAAFLLRWTGPVRTLSLDDAFGITQPSTLLLSPSLTISLIGLLFTYMLVDAWHRTRTPLLGTLAALSAGLLVGMKVYAGLIVMAGLGLYSLIRLMKRDMAPVWLSSAAAGIAAAVFFPMNASYGFLIWSPLWPVSELMQGTMRFTDWELKRRTMVALGSLKGQVKLYAIGLGILFGGNFASRLVGILGIDPKRLSRPAVTDIMIAAGFLFSILFPLMFLQPIGMQNTIQFFWYAQVFLGMYAGMGFHRMLSKLPAPAAIAAGILVLALTLPTAADKTVSFFAPVPPTITDASLSLYAKLSSLGSYGDAVAVIPKFESYGFEEFRGWFYTDNPFIPALAGHRQYYGNEVVQFPPEKAMQERVPYLVSLMAPQTGGTSLEPAARNAAGTLFSRYRVRYVLVRGFSPWFEGIPWMKKVAAEGTDTVYEIVGI